MASAVSDIISAGIILIFNCFGLYSFLSFFIVLPVCTRVLMGKNSLIKEYFITLVITFLLGGIVNAIDGILTEKMQHAYGAEIVFAVTIGYFSLVSLQKRMRYNRDLHCVSIFYKGRCFIAQGKYDSGNVLRDSVTNRPVHIASPKVFEILEGDGKFFEVGYKSLGNDAGVLETCEFDEMIIDSNGKKNVIKRPLIGKASDELLRNLAYDIILNEAVFDDSEDN